MLNSRLMLRLSIGVLVLALLLAACAALGAGGGDTPTNEPPTPGPTPDQPVSITTERVQVVPGSRILFEGQSTLPDGTCLHTELSADDTPLAWWPTDACVEVAGGIWQIRVPLDEAGAPPELSDEQEYVLHVWERDNPALAAAPFWFDVSAPPAPGMETGMAAVDEIDILIMESFPVQVAVVARGFLPDGCTEIDEVRSRFEPESDRFVVEITTVRDADAFCTEALRPFEERVALDVYGLPAGTYFVDVNAVVDTFTFDVDNVLPEQSGESIPWDEARALILAGEVHQVTQLHSLKVTLIIKDGRQLVTMEPEIDDVFDVVNACGDPCADMVLATE
jgi:hypothetical protein